MIKIMPRVIEGKKIGEGNLLQLNITNKSKGVCRLGGGSAPNFTSKEINNLRKGAHDLVAV